MAQKFAIPAFFGNPNDPTNPNRIFYGQLTGLPPASLIVLDLGFQDGPLPSPTDPNLVVPFNTVAQALQTNGYVVLAYVDTDMGTGATCPGAMRPPADCYLATKPLPNPSRTVAAITPYIDFLYGAIPSLDGIFFDQGPAPYCFTGGPAINSAIIQCIKDLYSSLYQYVRSKPVRPGRPAVGGSTSAAVLLNAAGYQEDPGGSWIIAGSSQACDVAILWESESCKYVVTQPYSPGNPTNVWPTPSPMWWQTLSPDRISHTIFACANADDMQRVIGLSAGRGAGYAYAVDSDISRYDHLPPYWTAEVAALAAPAAAVGVPRANAAHQLYVRDWTESPTIYDTGNPTLTRDFWTVSDVWNRQSNNSGSANPPDGPNPFDFPPNNQPPSEDPRVATLAPPITNYAFARTKRQYPCVPDTAEPNVIAHFLWADFGTGSNFMDVGPTSSYSYGFAAGQMSQIVPPSGLPWTLPATASSHICLAVEVSSTNDPKSNELLGMPAGSATSDPIVRNDRKIAQRNLTVVRVVGPHSPFPIPIHGIVHNGDLGTRNIVLQANAPQALVAALPRSASISVTVSGGAKTTAAEPCELGVQTVLEAMQPGENRWVELTAKISQVNASRPMPITFTELADGRVINGFTIIFQPATIEMVIHDVLRLQGNVLRRLHAADDNEGAEPLAIAGQHALRQTPLTTRAYGEFMRTHLGTLQSVLLGYLARHPKDPFDVELWIGRLRKATESEEFETILGTHIQLVQKLDATLTMHQKDAGDQSDILQMVRWQHGLYAKGDLAKVQDSTQVTGESQRFIEDFRSRRIGVAAYPGLLRRLHDVFSRTADMVGLSQTDLIADLKAIKAGVGSPAHLERAHRNFLLKVQRL